MAHDKTESPQDPRRRQGLRPHVADGAGRQAGLRRVRHPGAEGRRRDVRGRGGEARRRHGLSGRAEDRLAGDPAQDRGRRRASSASRARRMPKQGFATIMANAKKYDAKANLLGVQVQQMLAGGQEVIVGAVTDPSFGKLVAFGLGGVLVEVMKDITFRLAPATQGRRAVDARRHPGGRDAEGRARRRSGQPRRARDVDRECLAADLRLSRDLGDGPESGVRDQETARPRPTCASCATGIPPARALPSEARRHRARHEPDHEARCGGGDRRVGRGGQDRQLGDEEPHQRRLQGQDLPDQPVRRRDHGAEGVQERQGRAGRRRRRGVRDPREVRRGRAGRSAARRRSRARC